MFERILTLLQKDSTSSRFCTQVSTDFSELKLVIDPNGAIEFPLSQQAVKALIRYAQPAKFGLGENTLYDPRVRNVWEIPADRIQIDESKWTQTLKSVLSQVQSELNLPLNGRFSSHLHNLLIYEPGQFFLGHQDSEKIDGMIGTLVVLLPSLFEGGDLVINQHGDQRTFSARKTLLEELSFIAFYTDCVHEVKPVTAGYRIALTYNLVFACESGAIAPRLNEDLTAELGQYFFDPSKTGIQAEGGRPPWLVYLLDHEYSERGLTWNSLKGVDRLRAEELLGSMEKLGLTAHLALADIHQCWSTESNDGWGRYGRDRYRYYDDEDDDGEDYQLTELISDECELHRWMDSKGQQVGMEGCGIPLELMCWTKPLDEYKPFKSDYEPYTGNAGNTLDRWYHRAAIVLWPKESDFASLRFIDLPWTLNSIGQILSKNITEGHLALRQVLPHWRRIDSSCFLYSFGKMAATVVKTAIAAKESNVAEELLLPLGIQTIINTPAFELLPLAESYGESWFLKLMQDWKNQQQKYQLDELDNLRLLVDVFNKGFHKIAIWMWEYQYSLAVAYDKESQIHGSPKSIKKELAKRMARAESLLRTTQVLGETNLSNREIDHILSFPALYPATGLAELIQILLKNQPQSLLANWGIDRLLIETKSRLKKQAGVQRKEDDWSIREKVPCSCRDCEELKIFLTSSKQQKVVWPLAKSRRQHIHEILESMEIAVTHVTQHTGSPHKLILTKSTELFILSLQNVRLATEQLNFLGRYSFGNRREGSQ